MDIKTVKDISDDREGYKIRVLVIGDPHFKVDNIPEAKIMCMNICEVAEKAKPDFIVCLGDILHRHANIHVSPLMQAEEFIGELSKIAYTYLLIGNHDRPNNSNYLTTDHPFNPLKRWENVCIVDKVVNTTHNGQEFTFVPYVPTGKFNEALEDIDYQNSTAIFAHQEFMGAKMGAIESKTGDIWSDKNPLVISGHIHDYDRLSSNVLYIGTPLQHGFGDKTDKTISMFDFNNKDNKDNKENDGKENEWNEWNEWKETRIDLDLMKKITITLTPEKLLTYEPDPRKLIKIIVKGDESEIKECVKRKEVKILKQQGVKIQYKTIPKNINEKELFSEKVKYLKRLENAISKSKHQKLWFDKLFASDI